MKQKFELLKGEAEKRLLLFLKLRKGKVISENTIVDFQKLIYKLSFNFKDHDEIAISRYRYVIKTVIHTALLSVKNGFVKLENGGVLKITEIEDFGYYNDEKYRVKVKGELKEISEKDFITLKYIIFGEE